MSYTHLLYHCNIINKIYRSLQFISLFAFYEHMCVCARTPAGYSLSCQDESEGRLHESKAKDCVANEEIMIKRDLYASSVNDLSGSKKPKATIVV